MFHFILRNPICSILLICLSLLIAAGIFFYSDIINVSGIHFLLLSALFIGCSQSKYRLFMTVSGLIIVVIYMLSGLSPVLMFGEIGLCLFIYMQHKNEDKAGAFLIIGISFLLHLYYIQFSDIGRQQHDLSGILYYMKMITKGGLNWRSFDPWYMYYFFHQPLHFVFAGYLYFAELFLWRSEVLAQEGLQYLSLFYTTATTVAFYGIFRTIELPKKMCMAALVIISFNPTLFLFSGYVSDDTPVLFWNISLIYFLLKWIKEERRFYIIASALCMGLGTLTKLSILVWVPAICVLFLYKLCQSKNKQVILLDICLFIIIAVPLSLLWIVRNHLFFDMAFYNIPDTSPNGQNFRHLSLSERISNFSLLMKPFLNSPYVVDQNVWLALIKTELFGEWDFSLHHHAVKIPALLLYVLSILFKLCSGIGGIWLAISTLKQKVTAHSALLFFFILGYYVIWGYAFKYSIDYPYVCSSDYRLFASLMLPEVILLVVMFQRLKATNFLFIAGIVYALLSSFIYVTIA